jgi:hypothetical protein
MRRCSSAARQPAVDADGWSDRHAPALAPKHTHLAAGFGTSRSTHLEWIELTPRRKPRVDGGLGARRPHSARTEVGAALRFRLPRRYAVIVASLHFAVTRWLAGLGLGVAATWACAVGCNGSSGDDGGDTASSCTQNCGSGGTSAVGCGDGFCDKTEDCTSCAADCGACACGDGSCDVSAGESCDSCTADCGECVCGDGVCELDAGEACDSCAADCGSCGCGDGTCDDASEDCDGCAIDCGGCAACGDASCDGSEDCESCPTDCGDGQCSGTCGDGSCDSTGTADEDCGSCAADCGACSVCGDGLCEEAIGEGCGSCPSDCGACTGGTSGGSTTGGNPTGGFGDPLKEGHVSTEKATGCEFDCASECADGVDNDFDGLIDQDDPDCAGPMDTFEG